MQMSVLHDSLSHPGLQHEASGQDKEVEVQQVKVGKGDKWTGVNQGEGRGDEDDV